MIQRDELGVLFDRARALPPEQRDAFLEDTCRDHAALHEELVSLLAAYEEAPAYFERLAETMRSDTSLTPAHAQQVRRLFDAVVGLDADERTAYLDRACQDDPTLRQEVESLLQGFLRADEILHELEQPASPVREEADAVPDQMISRSVPHYQIVEKLGGGGMGVVYKARHRQLDRFAALKFLSPHLSADDEAKQRFIHEAQTASGLDHANICTIFDIGETDSGQLYIAMAYYEGETLKKKIRQGPLPVAEALDYAVQIAEGLSKAHAGGIVHRDVKPDNVMVTREGVVKLVDFGIAKMGDMSLTQTGRTMGTVAYMSPEQARGEEVDARADVWSLGVVLYEMMTGQRPFQGNYAQAVVFALLNEDPVPTSRLNPDLPPDVEHIVDKCLAKRQEDRYQTAAALFADLYRVRRQVRSGSEAKRSATGEVVVSQIPSTASATRARVFISYKRSAEPDDRVAEAIRAELGRHHDVFIDKMLLVGTRWIEQLEAELTRSDFVIVLLSSHSVHSEMVLGEIEMAHRLAHERGGRPVILPIRLTYREPFAYPLSAYLDALNWASWEGEEDTPRLIEDLTRAIAEGNLDTPASPRAHVMREPEPRTFPEPLMAAQPPRLEMPEGTMDPQSAFYVRRPGDDVARRAITRQGVTVTIKGPRQMGKSSMLVRMMNEATRVGKRVLFLDFQLFNELALKDAETFFRQFCAWLTFKLKLPDRVDEYWQWPLGYSQCCTLYVEDCILGASAQPLVLAMDEVERVFDTDFRSDFFSMLRSWHNDRATNPIWKQLDLALITSTEPYQLIANLNQSPFNVGEIIELKDFSAEQVAMLNDKHGASLSEAEIEQMMGLLGGHPYLTRKAFYLISTQQITLPDLLATAADDRGPFGDHLRYHLFRLYGHDDLIDGLREVLWHNRCDDEALLWRLQGAGLILKEDRAVVPRCALYATYFRNHFDG